MICLTVLRNHLIGLRTVTLFDLNKIHDLCLDLGYSAECLTSERLEITLTTDVVLVFSNLVDESDALIGFKGTPWHIHGKITLMTGGAEYVELTEYELLSGLKAGEVVVIERFVSGVLQDRWVADRRAPVDLKYIQPHEEIRVRSVAD